MCSLALSRSQLLPLAPSSVVYSSPLSDAPDMILATSRCASLASLSLLLDSESSSESARAAGVAAPLRAPVRMRYVRDLRPVGGSAEARATAGVPRPDSRWRAANASRKCVSVATADAVVVVGAGSGLAFDTRRGLRIEPMRPSSKLEAPSEVNPPSARVPVLLAESSAMVATLTLCVSLVRRYSHTNMLAGDVHARATQQRLATLANSTRNGEVHPSSMRILVKYILSTPSLATNVLFLATTCARSSLAAMSRAGAGARSNGANGGDAPRSRVMVRHDLFLSSSDSDSDARAPRSANPRSRKRQRTVVAGDARDSSRREEAIIYLLLCFGTCTNSPPCRRAMF